MNFGINNENIFALLNRTLPLNSRQQSKDEVYRQTIRPNSSKKFGSVQIIEICLLIFILFEHTFVFILTFKRKTYKRNHE